jgi:hypothetical protein
VATQDTVTQLVAAMRRVARVVAGAGEVVAAVCTLDYSKPGKPDINWGDPAAKRALVSDRVNDALAVLEQLTGPHAPERDRPAADALGLLALVAGQDVEPAEGSDGTDGRWVIARRVAPDRVISTVDPQARHTRKSRSHRRDGYRGHLATEPDTGLISVIEPRPDMLPILSSISIINRWPPARNCISGRASWSSRTRNTYGSSAPPRRTPHRHRRPWWGNRRLHHKFA